MCFIIAATALLRVGVIVLYYEAKTLVPTTTLLAGVQGRDRQDRAEERE